MISKLVKNSFFSAKPTESVAAAAFIISLAGIASRLLGLVRDRILASKFGAGDVLDAYYAAFRVPDLVYNLLVLGALSAAFIPVFTELITDDKKKKAWELSSGILFFLISIMGIISLILAVFAPWFMGLVTPGFTGEKFDLTVKLTRIMFLSPLILGISGIFGGILVSLKKFLVYSLAPIMYNIGIIIGAIFFVPVIGPIGLAWGVVLGALMHMLIQYPAVRLSGLRIKVSFIKAFYNREIRKVFHLMLPRMMGVAVAQVNLLVITIFASTLAAGSLAAFNFANNIQSAPLGLFGVSFAIAVFPNLSAFAAKKSYSEFVDAFSRTLRQVLFFVIPISVMLIVLRAQIVRILLGAGEFNWDDTVLTLQILSFLAFSLFAQSMIPLLARAFYALQNTKIPFYTALFSEILNIALAFFLIGRFEVVGLAIAFSVSTVVNMGLLFHLLRKKLGYMDGKRILVTTSKIIIASALAGGMAQLMKVNVGVRVDLSTFMEVFVQFVLAAGSAVATFLSASYILKIEEFNYFMKSISKKLYKTKQQIKENTTEVAGI